MVSNLQVCTSVSTQQYPAPLSRRATSYLVRRRVAIQQVDRHLCASCTVAAAVRTPVQRMRRTAAAAVHQVHPWWLIGARSEAALLCGSGATATVHSWSRPGAFWALLLKSYVSENPRRSSTRLSPQTHSSFDSSLHQFPDPSACAGRRGARWEGGAPAGRAVQVVP